MTETKIGPITVRSVKGMTEVFDARHCHVLVGSVDAQSALRRVVESGKVKGYDTYGWEEYLDDEDQEPDVGDEPQRPAASGKTRPIARI